MNRDLLKVAELTRVFEDAISAKGRSRSNQYKVWKLINSRDTLSAVFCPKLKNGEQEQFSARLMQMYDAAQRPGSIRAIVEAIDEYGTPTKRTTAVFLVSLVNLGMSSMNENAQELGRAHDHNEIEEYEYQRKLDKLSSYQENLNQLLDHARNTIKREARELSRRSGIAKKLCQSGLYTVPEPEYLDQYKIGYYLDVVLANVYGFVDAVDYTTDYDEVSWGKFFAGIFGSNRVPDVASLILTESPDRIDKYDISPSAVRACWDSLTAFAIKALNRLPSNSRDHMIELYLKRMNRLLDKHGINLRVDLRRIDRLRFDALADTVGKYVEKFNDMMKRMDEFDSATPDRR